MRGEGDVVLRERLLVAVPDGCFCRIFGIVCREMRASLADGHARVCAFFILQAERFGVDTVLFLRLCCLALDFSDCVQECAAFAIRFVFIGSGGLLLAM